MRLTRRTATLELGGAEYTATELTCAEAEAIEDLWTPKPGQSVRPLRLTAESVAIALKAKHPDVTGAVLMAACSGREILAAMKVVNEISAIKEGPSGEASSP